MTCLAHYSDVDFGTDAFEAPHANGETNNFEASDVFGSSDVDHGGISSQIYHFQCSMVGLGTCFLQDFPVKYLKPLVLM